MRKFIICSLALGIVAIVSTTVIESGHKSITVSIDSIDHAKLTLAAGVLPVKQVDEPF